MARMSKRSKDASTGRFIPEEEASMPMESTKNEKMKVGQTKRKK